MFLPSVFSLVLLSSYQFLSPLPACPLTSLSPLLSPLTANSILHEKKGKKKKTSSRDGEKRAVRRTEINGQMGSERERDVTVVKERERVSIWCLIWSSGVFLLAQPSGPVNDRC